MAERTTRSAFSLPPDPRHLFVPLKAGREAVLEDNIECPSWLTIEGDMYSLRVPAVDGYVRAETAYLG